MRTTFMAHGFVRQPPRPGATGNPSAGLNWALSASLVSCRSGRQLCRSPGLSPISDLGWDNWTSSAPRDLLFLSRPARAGFRRWRSKREDGSVQSRLNPWPGTGPASLPSHPVGQSHSQGSPDSRVGNRRDLSLGEAVRPHCQR